MSDVVGLDEVKRQVRLKVIYPLERPELFRAYRGTSGGGILLYGPPGTGKTMIARAIASEVEAPFYAVKPSDILGMYVGVSERNIARLFQILREAGRAVVFFDELDALLPSREGGGDSSGVMGRVVPQFLQELQGVATKSDAPGPDGKPRFLLALGATNVPWAIDPAVLRPGRFDELIYIPLPDLPARRLMLERNTRERPLDQVDFDELARQTDGFSGADIAELCENTAERVLERAIDAGQVLPIRQQDFLDTLAVARPSVRPEHLKRFEHFASGR
jgi:SpoVK/Ycf46/Vps4 family AAA+-type ATPase